MIQDRGLGFSWGEKDFPRDGYLKEISGSGFASYCSTRQGDNWKCGSQVVVNLFFDGTGNNKESDEKTFSHTNVARLYYACDGSDHPEKTRDGWFFKHYLQGVGTPFEELGETTFSTRGKAFADGFSNRIGWAYTRLLNAAYAATPKSEKLAERLLEKAEAFDVCKELSGTGGYQLQLGGSKQTEALIYQPVLQNKLARLATVHKEHTTPNIYEKIRKIWINVFGFSRGAAEARVFINRLINDWAPHGKLAGAIDYEVNFMGLFDTVASVGIPDSARAGFVDLPSLDGHWGWADDGSLDIPHTVRRCVHFIATHEQRMSFPLDLIRQGPDSYPGNRSEVAYPGVHSDVGGGYRPNDQGKAWTEKEDDMSHKLGQIPLHDMYIEAVLAGVPMLDWSAFNEKRKNEFKIADDVVDAYNAWRKEMPSVSCAEEAIRLGMAQRLAWHAKRSLPKSSEYITVQPFYQNAQEDKLTPYQLNQLCDAERNALIMQRNSRLTVCEDLQERINTANDADKQILQRQLDESTEKIRQYDEQIQDEGGRLEKFGDKEPNSHRLGENAYDLLTNDKTDLREGAEEFRLLMGYLFPEERKSVWNCEIRPCRTPSYTLSLVASQDDTLTVQREATRDGKPLYVELIEKSVAQTVGRMTKDDPYFDVLLLPDKKVIGFLREHTNKQARAAVSAAVIRLFDDFVHDSRAWFRVPYFHEQAPGGYGWPRVLFQGKNSRVEFLDIST